MRLKRVLSLALLAVLAACGRADDQGNAGTGAGANESIVPPSQEAGVARAPDEAPKPAPTLGEMPLDQLAGVKVGKTIAELRAQGFSVTKDDGPDPDNSCGYARIAGLKDLFFMLDGDTVVRIDVDTPDHPTLGGVTVGMSEAEALRRLAGRVKVQPHPYTGPQGHYLVVHEAGAPLGLILETDKGKVVSYRIGRWAPVQWVEGCL